jgi:phage gp16-like protein
MQQLLLALILISAAANYVLYKDRESLQEEVLILEGNQVQLQIAIEEQQKTIENMEAQAEKQSNALVAMQAKNAQINEDMNRYLDIFKRHNLNQLASAKPGLIEKRFNKGTQKIFETIENDSKTIAEFNN